METNEENRNDGTKSPETANDAATWRRALARAIDFAASWIAAMFIERVVLLDWAFGFKIDLTSDQWDGTMASWCHACLNAAVDAGFPEWLQSAAMNAPAAIEWLFVLALLCAVEAGFLAATGVTMGTWLTGIRRRRTDGGRIGFPSGFMRTLRIVAPTLTLFFAPLLIVPDWADTEGFILGFALAAIDPFRQIVRKATGLPFSWDARFATRVVRRTASPRKEKRHEMPQIHTSRHSA